MCELLVMGVILLGMYLEEYKEMSARERERSRLYWKIVGHGCLLPIVVVALVIFISSFLSGAIGFFP
jgi:hypothetical protein